MSSCIVRSADFGFGNVSDCRAAFGLDPSGVGPRWLQPPPVGLEEPDAGCMTADCGAGQNCSSEKGCGKRLHDVRTASEAVQAQTKDTEAQGCFASDGQARGAGTAQSSQQEWDAWSGDHSEGWMGSARGAMDYSGEGEHRGSGFRGDNCECRSQQGACAQRLSDWGGGSKRGQEDGERQQGRW